MFDELIVGIGVLGPVVGTCTGWPAVVGAADVGIYTALFVIFEHQVPNPLYVGQNQLSPSCLSFAHSTLVTPATRHD